MVTDDEFAADRARRVATVAFDLDGTLVDTMGYAPQVYANTIRRLGGPGVTPKKVVDVWHIGPTAAFLRHFLRRDVSEAGIDVYFDILVAGDDGAPPKPNPEALLRLLDRLDVEPSDAAYVDDDEVDLRCAESAHALPVLAGWARNEAGGRTPHVIVERPADIADRLKLDGRAAKRRRDCP